MPVRVRPVLVSGAAVGTSVAVGRLGLVGDSLHRFHHGVGVRGREERGQPRHRVVTRLVDHPPILRVAGVLLLGRAFFQRGRDRPVGVVELTHRPHD
jgi:hypothetical protein